MEKKLEKWVDAAKAGDQKALELVILEIKDWVYNLSLRMLLFPADAQDASQEILIRIVTRLSTFKQQSQFKTWVYRVATNYLLTVKGKRAKQFAMSFEDYANQIDRGQSSNVRFAQNEGELNLLEEEVKVSCTHGLLLCLNEKSRIAYILGCILEMDSKTGAQIMEVRPENFRKLLSRARAKIKNFLNQKCGLANPSNPCRCKRKINFLAENEIIDPGNLRFAPHTNRSIELINQIGKLEKHLGIYQSTPQIAASEDLIINMKKLLKKIS